MLEELFLALSCPQLNSFSHSSAASCALRQNLASCPVLGSLQVCHQICSSPVQLARSLQKPCMCQTLLNCHMRLYWDDNEELFHGSCDLLGQRSDMQGAPCAPQPPERCSSAGVTAPRRPGSKARHFKSHAGRLGLTALLWPDCMHCSDHSESQGSGSAPKIDKLSKKTWGPFLHPVPRLNATCKGHTCS